MKFGAKVGEEIVAVCEATDRIHAKSLLWGMLIPNKGKPLILGEQLQQWKNEGEVIIDLPNSFNLK